MKPLLVANWKMNPGSPKEAKALFDAVKKSAVKNKKVDVVICPPYIYLGLLSGLPIGSQDVSYRDKGAYTGEVSVSMLKAMKMRYVLIGHSERRKYHHETHQDINQKIKAVVSAGLTPIFCVGEQDGQDKSKILEEQLAEGLQGVSGISMKKIVIAYEPVWAIGTGKNCSVEETMSSVLSIKSIITRLYNRSIADQVAILYGGSVNAQNAIGYVRESHVDGLLVGGASLDAKVFGEIIKQMVSVG